MIANGLLFACKQTRSVELLHKILEEYYHARNKTNRKDIES